MVTGFVRWVVTGRSSGLHVWRALGLWTHPGPAVSMLTRPLSASSVRWLSGDLLVNTVVRKEGRVGNKRMGSRGVSVGCSHQGGTVEKGTGLHGQWVRIVTPQGHGAVASWDNWSQPQLPIRLALRNAGSQKHCGRKHIAGPSETPNQQPRWLHEVAGLAS